MKVIKLRNFHTEKIPHHTSAINRTALLPKDEFKYLEIYVDRRMAWKKHTAQTTSNY